MPAPVVTTKTWTQTPQADGKLHSAQPVDVTGPTAPSISLATATLVGFTVNLGVSSIDVQSGVAAYRLEYATAGATGPWTQFARVAPGSFPYVWGGGVSSRQYWVRATPEDASIGANLGPASNVATITTLTASGGSGSIKFNPGHYMTIDTGSGGGGLTGWVNQIAGIANETSVRGVSITLKWGELEGATVGDFTAGFNTVDTLLNACKLYGKQLMLAIETNKFGYITGAATPTTAAIHSIQPAYLDATPAAIWPGGNQWSGTLGVSARLWTSTVMDAFITMCQAYATRYNGEPNFEMVSSPETSIGVPVGTAGFSWANWLAQLLRWLPAMRTAWANTAVRLQANYFDSDTNMISLIAACETSKIAVGGPDCNEYANRVFQANEIFAGRVGGTDYRNAHAMPWVNELQIIGFRYGTTSTASSVYNDTKNGHPGMQPQYWQWVRGYGPGTGGSTTNQKWNAGTDGELQYIRSISGAVNTTRPTGY